MPSLIELFLAYKETVHYSSPLTIKAYRQDLHALEKWFCGHPLEALGKVEYRRYITEMRERGVADMTRRRRHSTCGQFYDFLINELEMKEIEKNPVKGLKVPVEGKEESYHLPLEYRRQLLGYLEGKATSPKGKMDLAFYGMLYYGALRVTEGVSRRLADIIKGEDGHYRLNVLGKRNKRRVVIIHPTAFHWLSGWLDARENISDFIFIHPTKKRVISRQLAWDRLKRIMRNAGFPEEIMEKTGNHTLRHTRASDLSNAGVDMKIIQDFLGHSSVAVTALYVHKTDGQVDEAVLGVD